MSFHCLEQWSMIVMSTAFRGTTALTSIHVFESLLGVVGRHVVDVGEAPRQVRVHAVAGDVDALHRAIDGEDLHQVLLVHVARQLPHVEPRGLGGGSTLAPGRSPGSKRKEKRQLVGWAITVDSSPSLPTFVPHIFYIIFVVSVAFQIANFIFSQCSIVLSVSTE